MKELRFSQDFFFSEKSYNFNKLKKVKYQGKFRCQSDINCTETKQFVLRIPEGKKGEN